MHSGPDSVELKKKMRRAKAIIDTLNFTCQKPCSIGISHKGVSQLSCICGASEKNKKLDEARKLLETGIVLSREVLP